MDTSHVGKKKKRFLERKTTFTKKNKKTDGKIPGYDFIYLEKKQNPPINLVSLESGDRFNSNRTSFIFRGQDCGNRNPVYTPTKRGLFFCLGGLRRDRRSSLVNPIYNNTKKAKGGNWMFSLFRRRKKEELEYAESGDNQPIERIPDFPLNECFLFRVKDKFFVGMCYDTSGGKLHFILPDGVFVTDEEVKVIREATQKEKMSVQKTKRELETEQIVRYLRYVDL